MKKTKSGWIAVGKFVKAVAEINGSSVDIYNFRESPFYSQAIEIFKDIQLQDFLASLNFKISDFFVEYKAGFGKRVRSSYTPFKVFQLVALWIDKKHLREVLDLLEQLNEYANLKGVSATAELEALTAKYKEENELLKQENIRLKTDIKKLTTPHNKLFDSCLYGRRYGDYIHIKYRKEVIAESATVIKVISMVNAADVLVDFKFYAKKLGLLQSVDSKWVVKYTDREKAYKMIEEIKDNTFDIYAYSDTAELIDEEVAKLTAMKATSQRAGKIAELEYCKENNYTPWMFIPTNILNKYNCAKLDSGIDFVKIEDNVITVIGQVKYRSGGYITRNDISSFLCKCRDSKYSNCKKKLILRGCNISKRLCKQLYDIEIEMM